ncbi:MAG: hypothetical protein FJ125_05075 [Deltaproteobacteria bacterium]|nr:hypothetical protein [Deltaproteobacteria bacterium]
MIPQSKRLSDGRLASWTVDGETLRRIAPWAIEQPARLERELSELVEHFPTWLVTFGQLRERPGWPWAALRTCRSCGELLVPDRGVRCVGCGLAAQPGQLLVGFTGRLPALASDRPFCAAARQRAAALRSAGQVEAAAATAGCFLQIQQSTYFAPPVWVFCPSSFPHGEPLVMVRPDYFEVLGIPAEHVYPGTRWRLCNYASWPGVTVRTVLQQRIVPRLYLDMMIADLAAAATLDEVLGELGLTMHALYNAAGRSGSLERFERLYRRAVDR